MTTLQTAKKMAQEGYKLDDIVKFVRTETLNEAIKLSDEIELRETDGGTKQWKAFKALRNTLRDRLVHTSPITRRNNE